MATATMYDGIRPLAAGIARLSPRYVAGYVNGRYAWGTAQWNLFPRAVRVEIAVTAAEHAGDVLDVETGDATPAQAAGWIRARRAAGYYRPTVYCSKSTIGSVRALTGNLVLGVDWDWWGADYTGSPHSLPAPGLPHAAAVAVQYKSTSAWDASVIYDSGWPHRTPPGKTATPVRTVAPPDTWPAGVVLRAGSTGGAVKVLQEALDATHHVGCRNIAADGIDGPATVTAVRNFQAWKHLQVDGVAGPATRAALGVR